MNSERKQDDSGKKSLTYRTLSGLFWMFSGSTVQAGLRMLVLVILARLLTPEDYGVVGAALIIVNFAQLFSQLGMGPALVQRPNLEERHLRTAFTVFTLTGIAFGGVIAATAPLVADFFQMDQLVPILRVASLAFPLQGLAAVPTALLSRDLQFRLLAGINVVTYVGGSGVVGIALAWFGFGAWALVGALLAQFVINVIMLLFLRPFPKRPQFDPAAFRELLYFGGGFTIARLLNYFAGQGDNLVVGRWLGAAALGLYGRAYQMLVFPVSLFGNVIDQVLFPSMAKVQDVPDRLRLAYRRGITLIALIYLPLSMAALILAPEIITVALGSQWADVILPFQILAAGMLFRANKIDHTIARATGAVYRRAWRQGVYVVAILGGAWVGQHWGVAGVAGGVFVALTVNFLLMVHLSLTLIAMPWRRFLAAYGPAMMLATATTIQVWIFATALRNLMLPALAVLLGSSALSGAGLLLLVYLKPQSFLGEDGMWMLRILAQRILKRLKLLNWAQRSVTTRRFLLKKNVKGFEK